MKNVPFYHPDDQPVEAPPWEWDLGKPLWQGPGKWLDPGIDCTWTIINYGKSIFNEHFVTKMRCSPKLKGALIVYLPLWQILHRIIKFGHIRHSCCCFAPVLVLKNIEWILRVGWISGCFVKRMGGKQPGGESGPRWPPAVHRCLREVRRLSRKLCSNGRQTHSNWKKGFIDMVLGMIFVRWEIEDWGVSWIWRGEKRERC